MKSKIITLMFSGLLAGSLTVAAQDTSTPAAQPAAENTGTVTNTPAPAADANASTTTNAPAQAENATATAAADTAPTAGGDSIASHPAKPAAPIIPLIVMDDVPLTDAIKNLARQANINYMLDPRISFGQPGPNGQPVPQPNVSIRWENISAEQAL